MTCFQHNTSNDRSDSVMFSFRSQWLNPLMSNQISVFFRNKPSSNKQPKYVYFYLGSPIMSVIGYARIKDIRLVTKEEAIAISDIGKISQEALEKYIGSRTNTGAIFIERPYFFNSPITLRSLQSSGVFHPPQNFFFLSQWGKEEIERLGQIL